MKSKTKYSLLSVAVLLLVWEAVSLLVGPDGNLPGPWKTVVATVGVLCDASFLGTVGCTLLRSLAGFLFAVLAGGILGIASGLNDAFRSFMKPIIVFVRTTPVVVFVLLAIVWFSAGLVPVFIGIIMMFPIVYLNVSEGIRSVDSGIVDMARFYGVGRSRMIRELYIPAIKPFAMSGVSNAVGLGWRAIVAAEVLSQPVWGIGAAMHGAQIAHKVEVLMAWAFITLVFGALFEKILSHGYDS